MTKHCPKRMLKIEFERPYRMLDLGFSGKISKILDLVPTERRTMLFSATYTQQIGDIAGRMLQDPEHIAVTPSITAAKAVAKKEYLVDRSNKRALFIHLITRENWRRVLVFTRTKHGADKDLKKILARRLFSKQRSKARKKETTASGKSSGPEFKSRSGRRNHKAGGRMVL